MQYSQPRFLKAVSSAPVLFSRATAKSRSVALW